MRQVLAAQEQKRTTIGDRRSGARLMERFEVLVEGEPAVKQLRVVSPERVRARGRHGVGGSDGASEGRGGVAV